jgi:Cellulose binding domain
VAVRAVGPSRDEAARPTVVLPSMPTIPVASALPSPAAPSPSPSRTPSHSPSARHSASRSPSPRVSSSSASPRPTVSAAFSATLKVNASWDQGYVAMVQVVNKGTKAASWSVTVSHSALAGLRLGGTWSAQGHQSGTTFVFTGGPLAPGKSASFGYQASKQGPGRARPAGCSMGAGSCKVS